jgi:hypothetical protein
MLIGTMYFGRVEAVGREAIATKFFILGVPLFPIASFYFVDEPARRGFEIPIHTKSVILGYARVGLGLAALIWGVVAWLTKHYAQGHEVLIGPAIVTVVAAYLTFGVGRISKAELPKRLMLKAVTGLAASPDLLPKNTCDELLADLEKQWMEQGGEKPWRKAVEAPVLEHGPLLFALATYHRDAPLAQRIWERMK